MKEIERKWLVPVIPEEIRGFCSVIQAYILLDKGKSVRIRNYNNETFTMTVKGPGTLIREEAEYMISKDLFDALLPFKIGHVVKKQSLDRIIDNKYKMTLAVVDNSWNLVEVEFPSEEEALSFKEFPWFGKEVTYDESYKMENYSQRK